MAHHRPSRPAGFTLLELIIVIAIMALATAGVSLALRDGGDALLEREGLRLVALLESGRAHSRASGVTVQWHASAQGFEWEGLSAPISSNNPSTSNNAPAHPQWLDNQTFVLGPQNLILGPDPIIAAQTIVLGHRNYPDRWVRITTDGLQPFHIENAP